jgi:hypothetical protein
MIDNSKITYFKIYKTVKLAALRQAQGDISFNHFS